MSTNVFKRLVNVQLYVSSCGIPLMLVVYQVVGFGQIILCAQNFRGSMTPLSK